MAEFKNDSNIAQSPPHIFDNGLFENWPEVENDKFDLNSHSESNNMNNEEKNVSSDFEVFESNTYSMLSVCDMI